ncbi:tetratricopeptide repeat protein [Idiomarina tyrosinivorans]|nr:CDC27 family protein [Idiomarina tyrosinivorans]
MTMNNATLLRRCSMAIGLTLAIWTETSLAQQTERVPALRERVYSQLARAQETADSGKPNEGLAILAEVESKADSMNSYERAMLWNFYGFMYYEQDQVDKAIGYFDKVINEQPIPASLKMSTLFSLAQLTLAQGEFKQTLDYLARWKQLADPSQYSKAYILQAQALYQSERYQEALPLVQKAIDDALTNGKTPDENWLILARALHYELKQPEQIVDVLKQLIRWYNKPDYWVQLAGMYGQLEQDEKQLAVLEAAYQQGYLTTGEQLRNLVQVYYFNELPYKAGQVLTEAMQQGKVDTDLKTLKQLAQNWILAKEYEKAVETLKQANAVAEDGEVAAQLAQVLLNQDHNTDALEAAEQALAKGGLANPGMMYLAKGMALLNLERYQESIAAFSKAQQFQQTQANAQQWLQYAKSQHHQQQALAAGSS